MPFTLDESSLLIKGRKGDSASFTFDFNQDISAYTVHFYIKKNMKDTDESIIITKEYVNPFTSAVVVNLTTEDTNKLTVQTNSYTTYYWGLKITNGENFAQTVIPQEFKNPPMMNIYPSVGGI